MDKETIKQQNSMRDVLSRYGMIPNRAGFISCPFHSGDRTASMKIYKDSYYCFGCGATGDIFTFVQSMDNCDFKTAFQILGEHTINLIFRPEWQYITLRSKKK